MPKYIPTHEDIYSKKACVICGNDVIEEDQETCCDFCEHQWIIFKEDHEYMMMQSLYEEDFL